MYKIALKLMKTPLTLGRLRGETVFADFEALEALSIFPVYKESIAKHIFRNPKTQSLTNN